jgi:acyl-CoA synthetase (AMP-forming)/AMP-acid ligase II
MEDVPIELLAGAVAALAVAVIAWLGDRRRMRRSDPDAVGLMPWTGLFFWALLAACVLAGLAVKAWLAG